jgi:hypothetical protein
MELEFAAYDGMDKALDYTAKHLGIMVLQAKDSDKVYAIWIYKREVKNSVPTAYETQQIMSKADNRRSAIARVLKGMSELGDIDLSVKFIPRKRQVELIKEILGDNLIEE